MFVRERLLIPFSTLTPPTKGVVVVETYAMSDAASRPAVLTTGLNEGSRKYQPLSVCTATQKWVSPMHSTPLDVVNCFTSYAAHENVAATFS